MNASSETASVFARGKLNLSLRVLGQRADGYHEILSWMQPVDWHDDVHVSLRAAGGVTLHCDHPAVPRGPENLCCRAAATLAARIGRPIDAEIRLEKRLPVGGGMGGGSADAAAVLRGLGRLLKLDDDDPRLFAATADVGSDVPFFLGRGAAIVRGRGTAVEPHPSPFHGWAALIIPPFSISTAKVYTACRPGAAQDEKASPSTTPSAPPWATPWRDAAELSARLRNDLTPAAFVVEPRLAALHAIIDNVIDGVRIHMSGSGSTLFALFDHEAAARRWSQRADSTIAFQAALRIAEVLNEPACVVRLDPSNFGGTVPPCPGRGKT